MYGCLPAVLPTHFFVCVVLASLHLQAILVQLKGDDEMVQLAGLTELCEYLSISTEDTLAAFPTEQVVPQLVSEPLCAPQAC